MDEPRAGIAGGDARFPSSAGDNTRRHRRAAFAGFAISVALHAAVFLAWTTDLQPLPGTVAAGLRMGDAVAAAGGGIMQAIAIAPPREIVVPPPPEEVPDLDAPEVEVRMPPEPSLQASFSDMRSGVAFPGPEAGPGRPDGTGMGDGGTEAEGRFRVTAPEPRVIVPEWDPPAEIRGTTVQIRILVSADGRALDVELRPRTPNAGFNRRLVDTYMQMDYKPGRRMGRPITAPAEITLIF
ncbi:MAG: hypothetical protein M8866_03325 [marine benthic group bacterium]|nr:hypothetical protein [Candidatus Benthicola marisminoris]